MTISSVLAWFAAFFMIVTVLKFVARKFGNDETNKFFRKIHKPMGIAMVVAGMLHGIFAGNPSWSTFGDFAVAPILFTFNWGTVLLILSLALGVTFMLRKKLKKHWMTAHRVLTVVAMIAFFVHIAEVGIQLPDRVAAAITGTNSIATMDNTLNTSSNSNNNFTLENDSNNSGFSGALLKDGVYSGQATGYKGTIEVSVIVENGAVAEIEVVSENDTPRYFTRAEAVLDSIVNSQSLEVDVISGATVSSAGLINAVDNALQGAVVEGALSKTEVDTTNVRRHGHRR